MDERGGHVYLEFILRKVELEYVLVFWYRVHAYQHLKQTISFQETALIQYQHHPELLQRERPLCPLDEDGAEYEYEVFRIPAFTTEDQESFFYVAYADEGPEAVACTSVLLLDLQLETWI